MTNKYREALSNLRMILLSSGEPIELSHAENTLKWLKRLAPDADEIMCIAAYAHDIERSVSPKVKKTDYGSYAGYKKAHAERSAVLARKIAVQSGYAVREADRLKTLIESAEFESDNPEIQLLCDADSISYFDNNITNYLSKNGMDRTKEKVRFMYLRSGPAAREIIKQVLEKKSLDHLLIVTK